MTHADDCGDMFQSQGAVEQPEQEESPQMSHTPDLPKVRVS